jgi:hypothetical protein
LLGRSLSTAAYSAAQSASQRETLSLMNVGEPVAGRRSKALFSCRTTEFGGRGAARTRARMPFDCDPN